MSVLAHNMKSIRKTLNCTQTAFAEVLNIGFRTYVRYESGERDAPAAVLIKLAQLGNISLDRLLTTNVDPEELKQPDSWTPPEKIQNLQVIGGSIGEGRLMFKGIREDFLVTVTPAEKKLISQFRRLNPASREKCVTDLERQCKNPFIKPSQKKVSRKVAKARNKAKLKKLVRTIKKPTARKK